VACASREKTIRTRSRSSIGCICEFEGFDLITYQRPKNADFDGYVETLRSWVKRLLDAGVRPGRISLVGFSRGGQPTAFASSDLAAEGINTALLAICTEEISTATRGLGIRPAQCAEIFLESLCLWCTLL
jgi:hypothetical protein